VINGETLAEHHLLILNEGENFTVTAAGNDCNLLIFGGAPLAGERYISWNFVSSSKEKLREAGDRWEAQEFGKVPDETEWIPLPTVL
jgi:redox-sensitive bicupin YhaK (pirin superfamily)